MKGSPLSSISPTSAADSQGSRLRQSELWEALALALVGGMLLRLRIRQELTLLIQENYLWLATLSGCLLLGLGGIQLIRILAGSSISSQPHQSLLPPRIGAGVIVVAAVLGLIVVPRPLSSQTALNRGVEQNLSLARESPEAFQPRIDPGSRGLIDWVRTLDVYPDPANYIDQEVNVDGFVIPYDALVAANPEGSSEGASSEGVFWLARFLISCCAADAYPVGLAVIWPEATSLEADQWLAVSGTMILDERGGSRQLAIRAESVAPIDPPTNPYAY